jgi:hypothetical protein
MFNCGGQGAAIPHEMEHYRRSDKSGHNDSYDPIVPIDDVAVSSKKERTFTRCANDVYNHVLSKTKFLESVRSKFKSMKI